MEMPSPVPQPVSDANGPYFFAQYLNSSHYLGALHICSNTLSVHHMDANFLPYRIYKVPAGCSNVLLTPSLMYTIQSVKNSVADANPNHSDVEHENDENLGFSPVKSTKTNQSVNAIGVVGANLAMITSNDNMVRKCAITN